MEDNQLPSVEQRAREWLAAHNLEMQRRREFLQSQEQHPPELRITHVSWRLHEPSWDSLSPEVQVKVKELQLKFKPGRPWLEALCHLVLKYVIGGIIVVGGMVLFVYLSMGSLGEDDPSQCPQGVTWGC